MGFTKPTTRDRKNPHPWLRVWVAQKNPRVARYNPYKQAVEVQTASTTTASERLAIKYEIKGLPLLTALTSLSFPLSFPYDFMHLIWSNLIVNLIHL